MIKKKTFQNSLYYSGRVIQKIQRFLLEMKLCVIFHLISYLNKKTKLIFKLWLKKAIIRFLRWFHRVFWPCEFGCEHSASFKSYNMKDKLMAARYDHTIVILKGALNSLTPYSFYVMGSSVSSNCTRKIHRTSTAEKEVNRKENTVGEDCQKATDSKDYNAQIPI